MAGTTDRVMPQVHKRDKVESNGDIENLRRYEAMTEARQIYHAERQNILQRLPNTIKDKFGALGYGGFQGKWYPVLLISPFDISNGPARSDWQQSYDEFCRGQDEMKHLGFWIGTNEFSLLRPSQFVPVENTTPAHTLEYDKLSAVLKSGYQVTKGSGDEYLLLSMQQMKGLVNFNPEQRRQRVNEMMGTPPPLDYDVATWLKLCEAPIFLPKSSTNINMAPICRKRSAPENAMEGKILPKYPKQHIPTAAAPTTMEPPSATKVATHTNKVTTGGATFSKTQKEVEQSFRESEKRILRTVKSLRGTSTKQSTAILMKQLEQLQRNLPHMCWQFIAHYKVGYVLKPAKELLKSRGKSIEIISNLKQAIKSRYKESKEEYPHDLDLAWLHSHVSTDKSIRMGKKGSARKPRTKNNVKQSPPPLPGDSRVQEMVNANYSLQEDEKAMREWLFELKIPQSTADKLVQHGARCILDVKTLVKECPSVLDDFPTLDRWKLKNAVDRPNKKNQI